MCLAQGPQRSDAGEARTHGPSVLSQALVFGNYRSSYVMVKMIRGGKPWEQGYCSKGNKDTFVHTCISCI